MSHPVGAAAEPGDWTAETPGMRTVGCRLQVPNARFGAGVDAVAPGKVTVRPDFGQVGDMLGANRGQGDFKMRFEGCPVLSLTEQEPRGAGMLAFFWVLGDVSDARYHENMQRPSNFQVDPPRPGHIAPAAGDGARRRGPAGGSRGRASRRR